MFYRYQEPGPVELHGKYAHAGIICDVETGYKAMELLSGGSLDYFESHGENRRHRVSSSATSVHFLLAESYDGC